MTTSLRSAPSLLLVALVALAALPALPAAGAAGTAAEPEPGPLSPAFVEALHDPLVAVGLGRLPSPVEVHLDAAAESRAARMAEPSFYSLIDEGRLTPVKDQGSESTCWAFANIAALESRLMRADPPPDFSEDNLVGRAGYGPFPYPYDAYSYGGYDFMAVAYFARWAGPLLETDDPYPTRSRPPTGPVQDHVQGVVIDPRPRDRLRQRPYQASRARERRAERRHVLGEPGLQRSHRRRGLPRHVFPRPSPG